MADAEVAAAVDKRAASRKKGGGKGRKGGHGYMFNAIFKAPFADALEIVPQLVQFPPNGVLDKEHVAAVQNALQRCVLEQFKPIHEAMQARKSKERNTKWSVLSDAVHRYVYGIYRRDMIPSYIVTGVNTVSDPRWRNVFTQLLLVKHNHLTVSRAIEGKRDSIPHLMDLDGKILSEKVPKEPYPPEFFETITVPELPAPAASKAKQSG